MMTLDAVRLAAPLQALVDARLETIERMLIGRLPRQDRLAIVREVEAQILEQVGRSSQEELSREDVLAVLASLDPPEAYLPVDDAIATDAPHVRSSVRPAGPRERGPTGQAGGILGILSLIVAVVSPMLFYALTMAFDSEIVFFAGVLGSALVVLIMAVVSLVLSIRAGLRKPWAIAGLVTSLCGGAVQLLLLLGGLMMLA